MPRREPFDQEFDEDDFDSSEVDSTDIELDITDADVGGLSLAKRLSAFIEFEGATEADKALAKQKHKEYVALVAKYGEEHRRTIEKEYDLVAVFEGYPAFKRF